MDEHEAPGFAVVDVETTGFSSHDRVLEIGVVLTSPTGEVEGTWSSLVNPDRDIPNSRIHGVYGRHAMKAPMFAEIAAELFTVMSGRVLVAHNAAFDVRMLSQELARLGVDPAAIIPGYACTMKLSGPVYPGASKKLEDVLERAGITNRDAHTALADAEATAELLHKLLDHGAVSPGAAQFVVDAASLAGLRSHAAKPVAREEVDAEAASKKDMGGEQPAAASAEGLSLSPGDRVTLTGAMERPRSEWESRARDLGLVPGSLTKKTRLLVAADVDSLSSKAKKARKYEIPIITEQEFAQLLDAMAGPVEGATAEAEESTVAAEEKTMAAEDDAAAPAASVDGELGRDTLLEVVNLAQDALGIIANQHRGLRNAMLPATGSALLSDRASKVLGQLSDPDGAYQRVKSLLRGTAASALADFYASLDPREQLVARRRLGTTSPVTLQEVGDQLGVTRERVRQLQAGLSTRLKELADTGAVAELREAMAAQAFPVARVERIVENLPELKETVPGWGLELAEIIDAIDDSFAIEEQWVCFPSMKAARERTAALLSRGADHYGAVPLRWVEEHTDLEPSDLRHWLEQCGYRLFEGHVLTETRSLPALGLAVLSIRGEPQDLDALYQAIGQGRSVASLGNALGAAEGAIKVSAKKWGLPEWGYEEYTSLADLIERRLTAALEAGDEGVALTALLTELPGKFEVAESSVRMNASTGEFELVDGIVKRRSTAPEMTTTPEESRGMYWQDGRWKLLVTVTADHVRGSGTGVPGGVIHMLGLKYNEPVELPSEIGTQRVAWGRTNAAIGTIKRLLDHHGIGEGERVWLDFHDGERFSIERARPTVGATGLAGVAEHVGALPEGDDETLRSAISRALGLGENAANRRILSRFRDRKDAYAVEVLEGLWL